MCVVDRRHLEYFLTVAESGSISAAARRLSVSQPTVSAAVARLEREQGVVLLRRSARGIQLTDAGKELTGPVAQLLRGYEELDQAVRPIRGVERGRVTLVCPRTLAHDPMATLLGRFRQRHPAIRITLVRPHDGETAASVVSSGRAEVGMEPMERSGDDLVREHLLRQHVDALVPPALSMPVDATLSELVSRGIITTPRGGVTRRLLAERLGEQVVDRAVVVETSSTGAMVPLVRAGLGVAFVSRSMAQDAVSTGVEVRELRPALTREVWLVHARALSPAARAVVELARELRDSDGWEPRS